MAVKIYTISDPLAIYFIVNNEVDGLKEYLDSDDTLYFNEPEEFATEVEVLAFYSGIGYGTDERAVTERYPLPSS